MSTRNKDRLSRLAEALENIAEYFEFVGFQSGKPRTRRGVLHLAIRQYMKGEQAMQLDPHKTFANLHTHVDVRATGSDGQPDGSATITAVSSAPDQVTVTPDPAGGFWVDTPLQNGQATLTFKATSPTATYEDVTLDYSYTPFPAGQLSVVIGPDVPDA